MGLYDTLHGYVSCEHCHKVTDFDIQTKSFQNMMAQYTIGSFLGDFFENKYGFYLVEEDKVICRHCKQSFYTYVIGENGYLYGYANTHQMSKIRPLLRSFRETPSHSISLTVSSDIQNNPSEIARQLQQLLEKKPNQPHYYVGFELPDVNMDDHVCRINGKIENLQKEKPNVNDKVYYDNRYNHFEHWPLQDELFTITSSSFNECNQMYYYTIKSDGYEYTDIPETEVIDKTEYEERVKKLNIYKQAIIDRAHGRELLLPEGEGFTPRWIYGESLVNHLKETNQIPKDFELRMRRGRKR